MFFKHTSYVRIWKKIEMHIEINFELRIASTFSWIIENFFKNKTYIFRPTHPRQLDHSRCPKFDKRKNFHKYIYFNLFVVRHVIDTDSSEWFFSLSICLYGDRLYRRVQHSYVLLKFLSYLCRVVSILFKEFLYIFNVGLIVGDV